MIHSPLERGLTTVQMMVNVHDVDAHYAHAVAAGADITMELQDAFYGERRYEATDLEGHRWHFAESFDAIRARGGPRPGRRSRSLTGVAGRPSLQERLQALGRVVDWSSTYSITRSCSAVRASSNAEVLGVRRPGSSCASPRAGCARELRRELQRAVAQLVPPAR